MDFQIATSPSSDGYKTNAKGGVDWQTSHSGTLLE